MSADTAPEVVVITGSGGMGIAIARRLGTGRHVVLADIDESSLATVGRTLGDEGFEVTTVVCDIAAADSVGALAEVGSARGRLGPIVHTAGVSPVQAAPEQIVSVDVIGTALLLDAFEPYAQFGTVFVAIASMAGTMTELPPETERALATTPTVELGDLAVLDPSTMDAAGAYGVAKRANQLRVEAASIPWGLRGARVVSISPGIISTRMGRQELDGPSGDMMRQMTAASAARRVGTAEDIASAVAFLVSPAASFISGTDLLIDGGVIAALHHGALGAELFG